MSEQRPAFDPSDPYQIMCEHFRQHLIQLYTDAERITVFREMDPEQKLGAFMSGAMTALIGVPFVCVRRDGHDKIMDTINQIIPLCRKQVESIMESQGLLR